MDATPRPRIAARTAFAALLWIAAAVTIALVIGGHAAPLTTVQVADVVALWLGRLVLGVAIAGAVALLLWPPAVPWLRLQWRRARDRMNVDRGPLLEAQSRLQHLETSRDHLTVGRSLLRMGQGPRAIPHLVRAYELENDSAQAAHLLGLALFEVGAVTDARRALERAVAIDPSHGFGDALLALGRTLERLGEDAEAERVLAQHEERYGPAPRADLLRARVLGRLGQRDRARALLERAAAPPKDRGLESPDNALARARARVARRGVGGAR